MEDGSMKKEELEAILGNGSAELDLGPIEDSLHVVATILSRSTRAAQASGRWRNARRRREHAAFPGAVYPERRARKPGVPTAAALVATSVERTRLFAWRCHYRKLGEHCRRCVRWRRRAAVRTHLGCFHRWVHP